MKIVYIAHPISGDVAGNTQKVLDLCKKYHTDDVLPFAPYLVALQYLDDNNPAERRRGIEANVEIFKRGIIDELWICGTRVSDGMKAEIELANQMRIPIYYK